MIWLLLAFTGALLYALTTFIDNYVTDELFHNKTPQAVKVANGASYLLLATFLVCFFDIKIVPASSALWIVLSGVIASLSSIPYYHGLKHEEATGAGIYYQLQPLFYLIADICIFHEQLKISQIVALALIMLAPVLIIFSNKQKRARKNSTKSALLFVFYIFLLSLSGIISTHAGQSIDYLPMFILFLIGRGISDITLSICFKSWRKRFSDVYKVKKKELIASIGLAQLFNISAEFLTRIALIIGTPAIVAAFANSAELVLIFLLGLILSRIWPNFGREKLNRRSVTAHFVAVLLCVAGIIILQLA